MRNSLRATGPLVLAASFLAPAALAQSYTFLQRCSRVVADLDRDHFSASARDVGWCFGYVQSLADLNQLFETGNNVPYTTQPAFYCPPETAKTSDGMRVIVKFMKSHPYDSRVDQVYVALRAMREAWPCKTPWAFGR